VKVSKNIVLKFSKDIVDRPIVCRLASQYNLEFNIVKAYITPREEGLLILRLEGESADFEKGLEYLEKSGVLIQPVSKDVVRNEELCTHCGVCVALCPAGALAVDEKTRKINFFGDKCNACGFCVTVCPMKAMEAKF